MLFRLLQRCPKKRVRDEYNKLFAAPRPSIGLAIAFRTGIVDVSLDREGDPEVSDWQPVLQEIDATQVLSVRIALFLMGVLQQRTFQADLASSVDSLLRLLKFSNADRVHVVQLARFVSCWSQPRLDEPGVRRILSEMGREHVEDLIHLWEAQEAVRCISARSDCLRSVQAIARRNDALGIGELAITGGELIQRLNLQPGPAIGVLLRGLLEYVLDEPANNNKQALLERAQAILACAT